MLEYLEIWCPFPHCARVFRNGISEAAVILNFHFPDFLLIFRESDFSLADFLSLADFSLADFCSLADFLLSDFSKFADFSLADF